MVTGNSERGDEVSMQVTTECASVEAVGHHNM